MLGSFPSYAFRFFCKFDELRSIFVKSSVKWCEHMVKTNQVLFFNVIHVFKSVLLLWWVGLVLLFNYFFNFRLVKGWRKNYYEVWNSNFTKFVCVFPPKKKNYFWSKNLSKGELNLTFQYLRFFTFFKLSEWKNERQHIWTIVFSGPKKAKKPQK